MSGYTAEQFEQIPEFLRDDYEKAGEVYRHKTTGKVDHLKRSLDALDGKYKETNEKLNGFEAGKAAEIEAAKSAALEEARTSKNVAEVERRLKEQHADELKQSRAEAESLRTKNKSRGIQSMLDKLAGLDAVDDGDDNYKMVASRHIDFDIETDQPIFLDANGSAMAVDFEGFRAYTRTVKAFKPAIKAETVTTGGGLANGGSNFGGSASSVNAKADAAKSKGDALGFLNAKLNL